MLPSDLPFYSKEEKVEYAIAPQEPTALEDGVRIAREAISEVSKQAGLLVDQVNHVVETGKAHTQGALFQLREEDNLPARVGLIAGTGTAGLMLGLLRGRLIKRVLYTGIGAGLGASVAYPEEANEAMLTVEKEGKKAVEMAQALANGGKKLSDISLPSATAASEMSLVAGRTIAHNIKIIITVLGAFSVEAYEAASDRIAGLVADWKFTEKLKIEDATQAKLKTSVPEIEVVTEPESEESSSGDAKKSQVVFLTTATTVTGVEGDPGMGTDEDKDLYTTRGN